MLRGPALTVLIAFCFGSLRHPLLKVGISDDGIASTSNEMRVPAALFLEGIALIN